VIWIELIWLRIWITGEGSCEHGNELLDFTKDWKILEKRNNWRLLKKASAP
jgi:hypothetical protein